MTFPLVVLAVTAGVWAAVLVLTVIDNWPDPGD